MVLSDLVKNERAIIVRINADRALKDRLLSFGVIKGEELKVKGCSIGKQTMEIDVSGTLLALRKEEADKIEVEKIEPALLERRR